MKVFSRVMFLSFFLFAFLPMTSHASTAVVYNLREFASESAINNAGYDQAAIDKIDKMIPSLQNRFCRLKIRPVAVVVTFGMVAVEWSMDRLCGEVARGTEVITTGTDQI